MCCAGRTLESVERTAEQIVAAGGEPFALRLDAVVAEFNSCPRETLGWETPAERLAELLVEAN